MQLRIHNVIDCIPRKTRLNSWKCYFMQVAERVLMYLCREERNSLDWCLFRTSAWSHVLKSAVKHMDTRVVHELHQYYASIHMFYNCANWDITGDIFCSLSHYSRYHIQDARRLCGDPSRSRMINFSFQSPVVKFSSHKWHINKLRMRLWLNIK